MVIAAVMVAGCADTRDLSELNYSERVAMVNEKSEICRENGLSPGSRQMEECIVVELQAENAKRSRSREAGAALAAGMQQAGQNMQAASRSQLNCTTRAPMPGTWRTTYNTTCY